MAAPRPGPYRQGASQPAIRTPGPAIDMSPLLFMDRHRRADSYPWFEWKVRLFLLGATVAVAGIALEREWMTSLALLILLAAFLIRFLPGGKGVSAERSGPAPDEGGQGG